MERQEQVLGNRALWGKVGYTGNAHAPIQGTYPGVDPLALRYTTVADSGPHPMPGEGAALANLVPLVMAAMTDAGFAWEAGPLSSWSN